MKRFSKILAFILTACILCGLIVTAAFANTEPAYTHPTLTNAAATNVINHNFEGDEIGAYVAADHARLGTARFLDSALTVAQSGVNGVSNNFWKLTLPSVESSHASFLQGSYGANQRSSYLQIKPNADYAKPEWYLGVYDSDLTDDVVPITNNFDYLTIDFDLSAQGARVDFADGTYGRATEVIKMDDGSIKAILEDRTVVVTNAAKTETTITSPDNTVTVITTSGNTVTETATAADGSKVVSVTVVAEDGSAVKTITPYDAGGVEGAKTTLSRSAVVNGGYTVTYGSGKTIAYAYSKVVDDAAKNNYTETETYTVTDAGVVTVYTLINKYEKVTSSTQYDQIITYRKTVGETVEAESVSTFLYKNSGGSHINKTYIPTFNKEFEALGEEFSQADIVGKHITGTRAGYAETSMYNTWRWYDASNVLKTSTNNFYLIGYLNGSWGIFREGTKNESYRIATLPDEIGKWSHITIVVEADNSKFYDSLAHFVFNGELVDTYKLSEKPVSSYKFVGLEDWRMTVSDILPKGDENYFSLGLDNITINTYKPTVTTGAEGETVRTPYTSGNAVGIDDFCAGGISLLDCSDVVFGKDYQLPNSTDASSYATVGGEKYYVDYLAIAAIGENAKNGETVETTMDLHGISLPEGVRYINIKCADEVECTAAANLVIEKTADGYTIKRQYVYADDFVYYSGNNASGGSSGTNSAGTHSTLKSVTYNGNAYTQYAFKAVPANTTRYRYDFALGGYSKTDFTAGYLAKDYSYFTVDFDVFADKYVYTDAEGNQQLTDTVPEGYDYKLAYADGMNIALDLRNIDKADSTAHGDGVFMHTLKFQYIDGEWHIFINGNDSGYVLSKNLYEVNHFTYATKVTPNGNNITVETRLYINGEYVATSTSTKYNFTVRAIDWYNTDANDATKLSQKYSVGLDNLVVNYYSLGYTSGDMAGVDDLFEGTNDTVDFEGIAFNEYYPIDPSVNGYVQVAGGEKIYNYVLAKRAIEAAAAGSVITATRSVYDVAPTAPFTFVTSNGSSFTLAEDSLDDYLAIKSESEGVVTYTVREPNANDMITLEWVDSLGNVIATETLLPSIAADASDKNASILDLTAGTAEKVAGWYWDLDGEGTAYAEAAISSFGAKDIPVIGGTTVKVYPKMTSVTLPETLAYIAYVDDDGTMRLGDDAVEKFSDIANVSSTVETCYDGTVIKFVAEGNHIVLPIDSYYQYGGKAITFDLNGKTLSHYTTEPYASAYIRLNEGASCTVTSSVPGARIFFASKRNKTDGGSNDRIFGADGLIQTNSGVDSATIKISNIEFNGGTMVKFNGALAPDAELPEYANDVPLYCEIDNVVVYAPNRSSYSVIATLCPDAVVEVTNSKFYVQDATYAFVHDYADTSSYKYYSETDLTMKNCEVLCYGESMDSMGAFWYTMGNESSLYVENSKILARLKGVSAARSTWGPGVEIATDSTSYFNSTNFAEGVKHVLNNGKGTAQLALSFKRADFTTDWSYVDYANGKYIDSVYTQYQTIEKSAPITFSTFTDETVPSYVSWADWYKADGTQSGEFTLTIVGDIPKAPISFADAGYVADSGSSWYDVSFTWVNNVDETPNMPEGFSGGQVAYKAVASKVANLSNMQANMSLSWGLVFNLYLLKEEGVTDVAVACDEAIGITESDAYYCISFVNAIDSFDKLTATISYKVDGVDFSDDVTVDAVKYAELVAKKYDCGSEEAVLAYEIIAYKYAVAKYTETVTEEVTKIVDGFKAAYSAHAEGCTCTAGLYTDDVAANAPELDESAMSEMEIDSLSFVLDSTSIGLWIENYEEDWIVEVSYKNVLGETVVHNATNGGLEFFAEDVYEGYRVHGIAAADIASEITITADDGKTVTYSLAQYIKRADADVAKALYSYSMAARAYKAITADEQAAQ